MLSTGAYSKKYQCLAREMRDTQQRASKTARDRAQLLSKQTAQRQRALEEKKRAMALAEEERRRKALEERRKTQQEATMRFKSAISRLKAASKEQVAAPGKDMHVQFYLPDKPWAGGNTVKYSTLSDKQSVEPTHQKATKPPERVITGREVEVTAWGNHRSLQRRTPSLDDVLRAVRGEGSVSTEPAAKSTSPNDQGSTAVGGMLKGRSASDTDLAVQSTSNGPTQQGSSQPPVVQNGHCARDAGIDNSQQSSVAVPLEGVVFQPVLKQVPPVTNPGDELQVLSPETPDSGDSPTDSLSDGSLQDSLDAAMAGIVRRQRHHQGNDKDSSCVPTQEGTANGCMTSRNAFQQARPHAVRYEEDSDSSSDRDCYLQTHKHTPPRSRRQVKPSSGPHIAEDPPQSPSEVDVPEPKVVGILKKPGNGSQSLKPSSRPSHSQGGSTLSSTMTITDQYSSHSGAVEGGRTNKRVRFLDQVDSPAGSVDSSVTSVLDPAFFQAQLWRKVLHNGFSTRFPPNSAFTPKMRVSLSSKAAVTPRKPLPSPPNGITVHMPRAEPPPGSESSSGEVESSPEARSSQAGQGSSTLLSAVLPRDTSSPSHQSMHRGECPEHDCEYDQPTVAPEKEIPLDKTPTDDDINDLWTQIRAYIHGTEKVSILPQVFQFLPEELVSSPASEENQRIQQGRPPQLSRRQRQHPLPPGGLAQKHMVHRPHQARPIRCQHQLHQPMPLWQRRTHNHTHPGSIHSHTHPGNTHSHTHPESIHSHTHPRVQVSAREPQQTTSTSMGKGPTTALSLEEQRLKHSIEKINQRLLEHSRQDLRSPDLGTPSRFPVRPPTPPAKHSSTRHPTHPPNSIRSRGPGDLPKTRVRRDPKVVAMAATLHAQSLDSRSQTEATVHRLFQNS